MGWVNLLIVITISLKHGFRLGLFSAGWTTSIVVVWQLIFDFEYLHSAVSSIFMYFIVTFVAGKSVDAFRQGREELNSRQEQLKDVIEVQNEMVARTDADGYLSLS